MRRWLCVALLALTASCVDGPIAPPITQVGTAPADSDLPPAVADLPDGTVPSTTLLVDDRVSERQEMVGRDIAERGITDAAVLAALAAVPRHEFVPEGWEDLAYGDHPLPIGFGQTISQPYIVALMTEALAVTAGDRVLEIGTGSGYQAAVLAAMDLEVFTIEIIPELAERAAMTLAELGYPVQPRAADGYFGWPEAAPFDAIIVTAAPDHVPQPLIEQLTDDGVMVIPVGPIGAVQTLWKFSVTSDGAVIAESLGPVSFVPFTRAEE